MKCAKNLGLTHQDFVLAKEVKKQLLKRGLIPVPVAGFVPVWEQEGRKNFIGNFVAAEKKCLVLSLSDMRSMCSGIRKDKPIPEIKFTSRDGEILTKPIADIALSDLISALKNFSLLLHPEPDETKWFHLAEGNKYVILEAERLSLSGRLSRIPLRALLMKYVGYTLKSGGISQQYDNQLVSEHRLTTAEAGMFLGLASELRDKLSQTKDKAARKILKRELVGKINDFCEAKKNKKPAPKNVVDPYTLNYHRQLVGISDEERQLRKDHERKELLREALAVRTPGCRLSEADAAKILAIEQRLITEYGMTDKSIADAMTKLARKRAHPHLQIDGI